MAGPAPAQITVIVPADADVFFDGSPMAETGAERVFATPALPPGNTYYYEIEAQWSADGQAFDQTRKIMVAAGAKVTVDFTKQQP
jgi:uncharacterized protein (TIGR03000 family)